MVATVKVNSIETTSNVSGTPTKFTVEKINNKPVFYGQMGSNLTVVRNTETVVTGLSTNEVDSHGAFNQSTFTCPSNQGGVYFLFGQICTDFDAVGDDGERSIGHIYLNDVEVIQSKFSVQDEKHSVFLSNNMRAMVRLEPGDVVDIRATTNDGDASANARLAGARCNVGGFRLMGVT
tara:strand:- start:2 stop:535 length:534 start_codon:yes stop_codon:yes gene_type:complete